MAHPNHKAYKIYARKSATLLVPTVLGAVAGWLASQQVHHNAHDVEKALVENPYILKNSIAALNKSEESVAKAAYSKTIKENSTEIFKNSLGQPVKVSPNGSVVEFIDYNCGVCKATYLKSKSSLSHVNVIIRQAPILGESSVFAAKAAIFAAQHNQFDAYHREMMLNRGSLTTDAVESTLAKIGLSSKEFKAQMDSEKILNALKSDRDIMILLGISGTPSYVTRNTVISGFDQEKLQNES